MKTLVFCLALCVIAPALAQDVPPPPKPGDDGPSLAETMKYIQDRLNGQGEVLGGWEQTNRLEHQKDPTMCGGLCDHDWVSTTVTRHDFFRKVFAAVADPVGCSLSFSQTDQYQYSQSTHWVPNPPDEEKISARNGSETSTKVSFRDVTKVAVGQEYAPPIDGMVRDPPAFFLGVSLDFGRAARTHQRNTDKDGKITEKDADVPGFSIYFQQEEPAQRMAKAMVHAVELCGGGDKDPFK